VSKTALVAAIISGGQTGADRGGLDAGIDLGLNIGGYVPKGRRADGDKVPLYYPMTELNDAGWAPRTRMNVEAADATAIFSPVPTSGGSRFTENECQTQQKVHRVFDLAKDDATLIVEVRAWLLEVAPRILNVAGPRERKVPGVEARVRRILIAALRG